jgi:hypothetical protein
MPPMSKRAAVNVSDGAGKPTHDTLALTAFLLGREWLTADDLREGLHDLGFRRPSPQWLTARLISMCKESAPRFERRSEPRHLGYRLEYRVTSWAVTGLSNRWPGFGGFRPSRSFPTPRPEGLG